MMREMFLSAPETVWPGENHQVWCLEMPGALEDLTGGDSPLPTALTDPSSSKT